MGRFNRFSNIAQCIAVVCFAGMVLMPGAHQAYADPAPIPQDALFPDPTLPRGSGRYKAAEAGPKDPGLLLGPVTIVSKPLELSELAPDAFEDWDQLGR